MNLNNKSLLAAIKVNQIDEKAKIIVLFFVCNNACGALQQAHDYNTRQRTNSHPVSPSSVVTQIRLYVTKLHKKTRRKHFKKCAPSG
ncbi:MAG: hypothetical protein ACI308_02185 [Muribaculaceae bacterium]